MKRIFLTLLFMSFFLELFAQPEANDYPSLGANGPLRINYPIHRMIIQRDNSAGGGKANFSFMGEIQGAKFVNKRYFYKIIRMDPNKVSLYGCPYVYPSCRAIVDWGCLANGSCDLSDCTEFYPTPIDNITSVFRIDKPDYPMGWYALEIAIAAPVPNSSNFKLLDTGLRFFGIGDVYVIAGQSNARGQETSDATITNDYAYAPNDRFPDDKLIPVAKMYNQTSLGLYNSPYPEAVSVINRYSTPLTEGQGSRMGGLPFEKSFSKLDNSVFNIYPIGRYSWVYGPLGKKIVENTGVPTAFFNTGFGWQTVGDFTSSIPTGNAPYGGLRNTLQSFANIFGIRGILWHQGEKDNAFGTSQTDYTTKLNQIIAQTRTDFDANLPWFVSKASLIPVDGIDNVTSAAVISGQNDVIAAGTSVFNGPSSDDVVFTGVPSNYGRGPENKVHFHDAAHETIGQRWYNANIQQSTPIIGKALLPLTITKDGADYKLSAPIGYAKYIWSKNDEGIYNSSISNAIRFSREITVSTQVNPDVYTCYVSNDFDADNEVNGWKLRVQITEPFVIPNTADAAKILAVSNNALFYSNTATSAQNLTVSSQAVVWQPVNTYSWVHLSNQYGGGNGDTPISITVDDNYTGSSRTASFQIQEENGGLFQTITVNQGSNPCGDFTTLTNPISNFYSGSDIRKANISIISNIEILNIGTSMQFKAG